MVRLCKPGGCICDPFAGSGSTLLAALQEGYQALGIEQEAHNIAIIQKRLSSIQQRIELPDGGYRAVSFLDTSLQKQEGK